MLQTLRRYETLRMYDKCKAFKATPVNSSHHY